MAEMTTDYKTHTYTNVHTRVQCECAHTHARPRTTPLLYIQRQQLRGAAEEWDLFALEIKMRGSQSKGGWERKWERAIEVSVWILLRVLVLLPSSRCDTCVCVCECKCARGRYRESKWGSQQEDVLSHGIYSTSVTHKGKYFSLFFRFATYEKTQMYLKKREILYLIVRKLKAISLYLIQRL